MGKIIIFSISGCRHCKAAKGLLEELQAPFVNIPLDVLVDRRPKVAELAGGAKTVPQIFFNEQHIGGNAELQELHKEGKLVGRLQEVLQDRCEPYDPVFQAPTEEELKVKAIELPTDQRAWTIGGKVYPYDDIVSLMKGEGGVSIQKRRYHLHSYPDTFVGSEFVDWMARSFTISREEAVHWGQEFMDGRMFYHVTRSEPFKDGNFFYRLQEDEATNALNMSKVWTGEVRPATEVAANLRALLGRLYDKYLDHTGVDYKGMAKSPEFKEFVSATAMLQRVDLSSLKRAEMIAFCINVYNMCVIHAYCTLPELPNGTISRMRFFHGTGYNLGGRFFSLMDIENGILRGNKPAPGSFLRPFKHKDGRRAFVLSQPEPRIHFALNCGAKSCPPVKVYTPERLEESLALATEAFLESTEITGKGEVRVTKLMSWYGEDFGPDTPSRLEWLAKNLSVKKQGELRSLMELTKGTPSLTYAPYDWSINAKPGTQ